MKRYYTFLFLFMTLIFSAKYSLSSSSLCLTREQRSYVAECLDSYASSTVLDTSEIGKLVTNSPADGFLQGVLHFLFSSQQDLTVGQARVRLQRGY